MKRPSVTPTDRVREFHADELFYSTTDRRGVIETGNDVFYRVADYTEADLIGEPHNVIRHPDMPRGAFKLVWDHLLAGRPIAAYVKNLARNGGSYWVLALIAPIEGGFISVRSKPCSTLFPVVEQLYASMKALEESVLEKGEPPAAAMAASMKLLGAEVTRLGFSGYDDFMGRALLPQELSARKAEVGDLRNKGAAFEASDAVLEALAAARREVQTRMVQLKAATARLGPVLERNAQTAASLQALTREAEGIGLTAMNVSLKAVQLGEVGLGTGVIAGFLGQGAEALRGRVQELNGRLGTLSSRLAQVVMEAGWGELEYEMVLRAFDEVAAQYASGNTDPASLARRVLGLTRLRLGVMGTRTRMLDALGPFLAALAGIDLIADAATEVSISLGAAHVGGRVESARLPGQHSMEGILSDLRKQLETARGRLDDIKDSVTALSGLRGVMASTEQVVLDGAAALERNIKALQRAFDQRAPTQRAA